MGSREKTLEKLFKGYSISTLDSISYVFTEGKTKNKDILNALADAYSNKSKIIIRANTEEAITSNFTLEEVKGSLLNIPEMEMDLLRKEFKKGYFKIQDQKNKSNSEEEKEKLQGVLSKISDLLACIKKTNAKKQEINDRIQTEFIDRKPNKWIDENYSDEELEDFFNKFSLDELGKIHNIFCCAFCYLSHRFFDILNRIQYIKYEELRNRGEKEVKTKDFDFTCITKKINGLSDKELELLEKGSIDSLNFSLEKSKVDSDFDEMVNGFNYLLGFVVTEEKSREKETNSLTRLFKKFDRYDQMVLRIIFEYATNYELDKEKEMIDELIIKPREKNLVQSKRLSNLTNKELNYLLELAENALSVLSIEFHAELDAELNAVYYFEERLVEEIGLRESSKGKFNDLNANKKKTKKRKNVKKM